MKRNHWAVVCPEHGLWRTWYDERCVALGWPPSRYPLKGRTDSDGWTTARKRLLEVAPDDIVIPYLNRNRFGIPGRVVKVAISDAEWNPTVERPGNPPEPGLGRRIYVEWLRQGNPPPDKVAVVPKRMRHANGEVHQAIEPLNGARYRRFMQIINDQQNWKTYKASKISGTTRTVSSLEGNGLYLERSRRAFPILVRQAQAGETIYYSDLADELGMTNPRNLNHVLGAIGKAIQGLGSRWQERVPPLQCLVVNKNTGIPGEGIGWFVSDLKDFKDRTLEERKQIVRIELTKVFNYPKWEKVLAAFKLKPLVNDAMTARLIEKARHRGGVGECEDHRRLKEYIAANPSVISLSGFGKGDTEHCFPSSDRIDILFQNRERWVGVEVKGPSSANEDLVRGLFQTVKYLALGEAELKSTGGKQSLEVLLVSSRCLSADLKRLKNLLGVTVIDGVVIPEKKLKTPPIS